MTAIRALLATFIVLTLISNRVECMPLPEKNGQSDILFESAFCFGEPDSKPCPEVIASNQEIVEWTASDKDVVASIMRAAYSRVPWLFECIRSRRPLVLLRVARAKGVASYQGSDPYSFAGPGYIVFTDAFFSSANKAHAAIHELVHAVDFAQSVAYSHEWIDFAGATISKIRLRETFLTHKGWLSYNGFVVTTCLWPSLYGAENLKEGLAEYVAALAEHRCCPRATEFERRILPLFARVSKTESKWHNLVLDALLQFKCRHYSAAHSLLLEAMKVKSTPTLSYYLTECSLLKKDLSAATELSHHTLSELVALGVTAAEPLMQSAFLVHSRILYERGDYDEATKKLTELLAVNPYDRKALFLRAQCNNRLGNWDDAYLDLYLSKGYFDSYAPFPNIDNEPVFVEKVLGKIVDSLHSARARWCRGQVEEYLASISRDPTSRASHLQAAEADYRCVLRDKDSMRVDCLFRLGELQIKEGHLSSAEQTLCDIQKLEEHSFLALILRLSICRAKMNMSGYREAAADAKREILTTPDNPGHPSTNPFALLDAPFPILREVSGCS